MHYAVQKKLKMFVRNNGILLCKSSTYVFLLREAYFLYIIFRDAYKEFSLPNDTVYLFFIKMCVNNIWLYF